MKFKDLYDKYPECQITLIYEKDNYFPEYSDELAEIRGEDTVEYSVTTFHNWGKVLIVKFLKEEL